MYQMPHVQALIMSFEERNIQRQIHVDQTYTDDQTLRLRTCKLLSVDVKDFLSDVIIHVQSDENTKILLLGNFSFLNRMKTVYINHTSIVRGWRNRELHEYFCCNWLLLNRYTACMCIIVIFSYCWSPYLMHLLDHRARLLSVPVR